MVTGIANRRERGLGLIVRPVAMDRWRVWNMVRGMTSSRHYQGCQCSTGQASTTARLARVIGQLMGLASLALALSACGGSTTTASTGSASPSVSVPKGWTTYSYGKAAISVPSNWEVKHDTNCPNTNAPGALLLGYPKVLEFCPEYSDVSYVAVFDIPAGSASSSAPQKPTMVNGVPVMIGFGSPSTIEWTAPSLGVEIIGTGPDTNRILHSLRSTWRASHPARNVP